MQIDDFVKKNSIVGITGNSGSGKSTFFNHFNMDKKT